MPSAPYAPRIVDAQLREAAVHFPAVSIEGARGVGKTRTAKELAARWVEFDRPEQREEFLALADRLPQAIGPLLLDEWQRAPETWDLVRRAVDEGASPGTFLLTGSVNRVGASIHSGAGRIVNLQMRPMSLAERTGIAPTVSLSELLTSDVGMAPLASPDTGIEIHGDTQFGIADYVEELLSSGFPGARALAPHMRQEFLRSYLEQIIQRDLQEGPRRRPASVRQWLRRYASQTAQTTPLTRLLDPAEPADAALPSRATGAIYHSLLESLWVIDELPGWSPARNELKKAAQATKHHLVDPGLAAVLMNVTASRLLDFGEPVRHRELRTTSHPGKSLGALLESLAVQSIRTYAQAVGATVSHLRTRDGREVDVIVEGSDGRVVAFDVKTSAHARTRDLEHLTWLHGRIGEDLADLMVLTTGATAFRGRDGIARVPMVLLGP